MCRALPVPVTGPGPCTGPGPTAVPVPVGTGTVSRTVAYCHIQLTQGYGLILSIATTRCVAVRGGPHLAHWRCVISLEW